MAADALQVLDEAGVAHAHVLGASLGGMIAQEVAVAAPERVDRLVLCCTTPGGAAGVPMPEVTIRLFQEAPSLAPEVALRQFVANALGSQAPDGARRRSLRTARREPARSGRLAGAGGRRHDLPRSRGRDRGADADPARHRGQRRRPAQRAGARRPDRRCTRRALRRLRASVLLGAARCVRQDRREVLDMSAADDRTHLQRQGADHAGADRDRRGRADVDVRRARRALRRARNRALAR